MENFCFSIDEERYDDRHGHVLSLDGWYAHPKEKYMSLNFWEMAMTLLNFRRSSEENDRMSHRHLAVNSEIFFLGLQSGFRRY